MVLKDKMTGFYPTMRMGSNTRNGSLFDYTGAGDMFMWTQGRYIKTVDLAANGRPSGTTVNQHDIGADTVDRNFIGRKLQTDMYIGAIKTAVDTIRWSYTQNGGTLWDDDNARYGDRYNPLDVFELGNVGYLAASALNGSDYSIRFVHAGDGSLDGTKEMDAMNSAIAGYMETSNDDFYFLLTSGGAQTVQRFNGGVITEVTGTTYPVIYSNRSRATFWKRADNWYLLTNDYFMTSNNLTSWSTITEGADQITSISWSTGLVDGQQKPDLVQYASGFYRWIPAEEDYLLFTESVYGNCQGINDWIINDNTTPTGAYLTSGSYSTLETAILINDLGHLPSLEFTEDDVLQLNSYVKVYNDSGEVRFEGRIGDVTYENQTQDRVYKAYDYDTDSYMMPIQNESSYTWSGPSGVAVATGANIIAQELIDGETTLGWDTGSIAMSGSWYETTLDMLGKSFKDSMDDLAELQDGVWYVTPDRKVHLHDWAYQVDNNDSNVDLTDVIATTDYRMSLPAFRYEFAQIRSVKLYGGNPNGVTLTATAVSDQRVGGGKEFIKSFPQINNQSELDQLATAIINGLAGKQNPKTLVFDIREIEFVQVGELFDLVFSIINELTTTNQYMWKIANIDLISKNVRVVATNGVLQDV